MSKINETKLDNFKLIKKDMSFFICLEDDDSTYTDANIDYTEYPDLNPDNAEVYNINGYICIKYNITKDGCTIIKVPDITIEDLYLLIGDKSDEVNN